VTREERQTMRIGNLTIGPRARTCVVAEMAWSHDGSPAKGRVIVDAAADAGADAVNLHLTSLPDYMVPSYGAGPGRLSAGNPTGDVYRYLERLNLTPDDVGELAAHAHERGLLVSVMCNDEPSLACAVARLAPDLLMVHPGSLGDERLLRGVAASGLPLVLYTGGLQLGEIDAAVRWARAEGNERIVLQHGFQSYPTALADNHLRSIATLKRLFGLPVAFADHTDGDDPMAMVVPLLAVALGADVIEKHLTHDRARRGEDYESALDPRQFTTFVERLRQAESALGEEHWRELSAHQLHYRQVIRKRAVAARALAAGEVLTRAVVAFKRADAGFYPEEIRPLLGKLRLTRDLPENAPLDWEALGVSEVGA